MVRGDETLAVVRFNEGWTFRQIRTELAKSEALRPTTAAMSDADIMTALGASGVSPEGRFHPDTYAYSKGSTDLAVLRRAYRAMDARLLEAWQERAADTPLASPADLLTLASIVEKETGSPADRGRVAGVFVNRLRIGMPLQTDPTVIFGLGPALRREPEKARPARRLALQHLSAYRPAAHAHRHPPAVRPCSLRCAPIPPRRSTSWRAATAAANSATRWPITIVR